MEIKVQIESVELAEAINNLAAAISAKPEAEATKEPGKRRGRRAQNKDAEATAAAEIEAAEEEETAEKEAEVTEPEPEADDDMFEDEKPLSRAEIQKRLKEIAGAGKTAGLKKLVLACGTKKLSEVPDDKLPELLKKAEAL